MARPSDPAKDYPTAKVAGRLKAHLNERYGIRVTGTERLDFGVFRVAGDDGEAWVARVFPATRPPEAAEGDGEILRWLEDEDFPAERIAADEPVSMMDGSAVLVTEWAPAVPRGYRRDAIVKAGGLRTLGALHGRLHTMALPPATARPATERPGGAWHHMAAGGPAAEVTATVAALDEVATDVGGKAADGYRTLATGLAELDAGEGLAEAFAHPDFAMPNVVATPDGMVLVDWAGAGRAPRVWSLAWMLYAEGARDLARVDRLLDGYRRHVTLTAAELDRLGDVMPIRPLVLSAWELCVGRITPNQAVAWAGEVRRMAGEVTERARAFLGA